MQNTESAVVTTTVVFQLMQIKRDPNELFVCKREEERESTKSSDSDQDHNNWMRMDGKRLECCFK